MVSVHRVRTLVAVSAAQLGCGVVGMVVAVRRKHPYDVFWMHGEPDKIARDTMFKGTALSAPISNFLIHATLTAVVARRPSRRTQQALGGLGMLLIAGYLGERHVRQRLRPSSWDALESLLLVAAIGLAAGMAVLGLRPSPAKGHLGSLDGGVLSVALDVLVDLASFPVAAK